MQTRFFLFYTITNYDEIKNVILTKETDFTKIMHNSSPVCFGIFCELPSTAYITAITFSLLSRYNASFFFQSMNFIVANFIYYRL